MLNFHEQKLHVTLKRIRFLTYLAMTFVGIHLAMVAVFGLSGFEISVKDWSIKVLGVTDLRPLSDRFLVVGISILTPILFLFGSAQVVFFTECFESDLVRRADAARYSRNVGIITIVYACIEPLILMTGHLLNISLFIIRKVPWNSAAKMNSQFSYQGNIIALSLMLAFMFFLVSHMLKVDESQKSQLSMAAAE